MDSASASEIRHAASCSDRFTSGSCSAKMFMLIGCHPAVHGGCTRLGGKTGCNVDSMYACRGIHSERQELPGDVFVARTKCVRAMPSSDLGAVDH